MSMLMVAVLCGLGATVFIGVASTLFLLDQRVTALEDIAADLEWRRATGASKGD